MSSADFLEYQNQRVVRMCRFWMQYFTTTYSVRLHLFNVPHM
jgi:hypothetical protein